MESHTPTAVATALTRPVSHPQKHHSPLRTPFVDPDTVHEELPGKPVSRHEGHATILLPAPSGPQLLPRVRRRVHGPDPTVYGRAARQGQRGHQPLLEHFLSVQPSPALAHSAGHSHTMLFPQLSQVSSILKDLIRIDFISALPTEVAFKILCYLDTASLCRAAQVSKRWKMLADDDVVWYRMCEQHIDKNAQSAAGACRCWTRSACSRANGPLNCGPRTSTPRSTPKDKRWRTRKTKPHKKRWRT